VFGIGMTELMVILVIALLVLGPKRLPGVARSLGKGLAEFRRASTEMRREFLDVAEEARIDPASFEAEPEAEPASAPESADPAKKADAPGAPADDTPGGEPETQPEPAGKPRDD
jgi:Tat protein translocase TatB subunit